MAGNKLFQYRTKGLDHDKILPFGSKNTPLFWSLLKEKEPLFGGIVTRVPIMWENAGKATKHCNLVLECSVIDIEVLQRNTLKRFDTATGRNAVIPLAPHEKKHA